MMGGRQSDSSTEAEVRGSSFLRIHNSNLEMSIRNGEGAFAAMSLSSASAHPLLADLMALRTIPGLTSGNQEQHRSGWLQEAGNDSQDEASARQTSSSRFTFANSLKTLCSSSKSLRKVMRTVQERPVSSSSGLTTLLLQEKQSTQRSMVALRSHGMPSLSLSLATPEFLDTLLDPWSSFSALDAALQYAPLVQAIPKGRRKATQMIAGGVDPIRRSRLRRVLNAIISIKNRRANPAETTVERFDAGSLNAEPSDSEVIDVEEEDVSGAGKEDKKKRVLILMSDTGGGHRASAEALRATIELEYGDKYEVTISDCWKDHTPFPFNQLPKSYSFLVKHETLWRMAFHATKPRFVHQPQMAAAAVFVAREVGKMLDLHRPDLIVSVHPLMQHVPLRVLRARGLLHRIPFTTVVTDLTTCHPTWFHKWATLCFCPTKEVAQRALKAGLTPPQLRVHGLPIRPAFSRPPTMSKEDLRAELGMHPSLPAALLIGGGEGMGPVEATALALAKRLGGVDLSEDGDVECEPRGQLVVVCGRNKKLRARLEAMDWPMPTQIMGFVSNMPDLMAACDCIITKAGPGTIAESLIRGLPLVLNDFIAGQEVGNVPYVVDHGAGVFCDVPREIALIVSGWFGEQGAEFQAMAQRARDLARPDAVFRIVRDLDSLVCGEKLVAQNEMLYA